MIDASALTDEQRAIVTHDDGPALVYAVAGAGKTTAMVHRVRRLVREDGVAPERILASSFSRATVDDIEAGLAALGVRGVACHTLHALGRRVLRLAEERDLRPRRLGQAGLPPHRMPPILARRALDRLAQERDLDRTQLGISPGDLADQVAAWKGQLAYADLEAADLPEVARAHAAQAEHPTNDDYVTLYRHYEAIRAERGWVTFADMLREGWEAMVRHASVRTEAQAAFEHVLVDEYQDVSHVQVRMLDRLTALHRNYMAIGDDDQCIYEWRGADPSFILDFADAYDATEYVLRDNFRSCGQQTSLANAVIRHNTERRDKALRLTRGFGGRTRLQGTSGPMAMAEALVGDLETRLGEGGGAPSEMASSDGVPSGSEAAGAAAAYTPDDCVVLVRQYAQTPLIEQALINAGRPYRIVGHQPFYLRTQVQALLRHCYWATLERRRRQRGWFEDRTTARRYVDRFEQLLREPNRYVSQDLIETITVAARRQEDALLDLLDAHRSAMHGRTVNRVDSFIDAMDGLIDRLDEPAGTTIDWLIGALDYEQYLREHSAFEEVADERINTARSLVAFAKGHPSVPALLEHVRRIAARRPDEDDPDALEIRSIHRAKGMEWPVVAVPGCNDGTIPNVAEEDAQAPDGESAADPAAPEDAPAADVEEERRLFYVALTRAQDELLLYHDTEVPRSRFLDEACAEDVLRAVERARRALEGPVDDLDLEAIAGLAVAADRLAMQRYLEQHWTPSARRLEALRRGLDAARERAEAAQETVAQYEADRTAYQEEREAQLAPLDAQRDRLDRKRYVLPYIDIPVVLETDDALPSDARITFAPAEESEADENAAIEGEAASGEAAGTPDDASPAAIAYADERQIGYVALDTPDDSVAATELAPFDWASLVATPDDASDGGRVLQVTVDLPATRKRLEARRETVEDALDPPKAPGKAPRLLATDAFGRGARALATAFVTATSPADEAPAAKER